MNFGEIKNTKNRDRNESTAPQIVLIQGSSEWILRMRHCIMYRTGLFTPQMIKIEMKSVVGIIIIFIIFRHRLL